MTEIRPYFLIAMPHLKDPNFYQAVVLIIPAPGDGEFGLVINRQSELTMSNLEILDPPITEVMKKMPIAYGGPVAPENLILIGRGPSQPDQTVRIDEGIFLGATLDFVNSELSQPSTPWSFRAFSGHAGWMPDQLQQELAQSAWLAAPFKADLLFDTKRGEIWTKALRLLGIDPAQLFSDPSLTIQ